MEAMWRFISTTMIATMLIVYTSSAVCEITESAPFNSEKSLRDFSNMLITQIGAGDINIAEDLARKNSHIDDEITQQNLRTVFSDLRNTLTQGEPMAIDFVQQSNFGRSFIRHQYALEGHELAVRCMLTFRRKTDGWRLNQLWCN